jgi:transposase-like protein
MEPSMTDVTLPMFTNEEAARAHFEAIRWPNGPVCVHCDIVNDATLVQGKSHRPGMYQCNACREPFSVTVGTVMESSHIPLNKWALGFHLMASSKKGISAHQLHRMLGITYKSAWFMAHRIREAMKIGANPAPMGSKGGTVEADETYYGRDKSKPVRKAFGHMHKVVSLVERGGEVRSFHVERVTRKDVLELVRKHMAPDAHLRTDESAIYGGFAAHFASHESVLHKSGEYVRGDVHTNTIEGFFSIFKRGMTGVYQHCGDRHLHRYLAEFDFRYSNRVATGVDDVLRTMRAIKGAEGKRLTYAQPRSQRAASTES